MKKIVCAAMALGLFVVTADAQIIVVDDNFNRADGSLTGTNPTPGPGGTWARHSGTEFQMQISGQQVLLNNGGGSEDVNTQFALFGSGVLTATFDINVNAAAPITGGDYEYFAHFRADGDFTYPSRLDVVEATGGGDYTLGLATGTGIAETIFPTDFSFGNTVSLALSFDIDNGLSSLTVGGTTIQSTSVILGEALSQFALRQGFSSSGETILVDNLVVSYVPEPTSLALGGFGLLTLLMARRRS